MTNLSPLSEHEAHWQRIKVWMAGGPTPTQQLLHEALNDYPQNLLSVEDVDRMGEIEEANADTHRRLAHEEEKNPITDPAYIATLRKAQGAFYKS